MDYIPNAGGGDGFLFIGEAGSGKSVIATSFACRVATQSPDIKVDLFDMDQTKPLFRSRDYLRRRVPANLNVRYEAQLLDTPVTAAGVRESLFDTETVTVIDAGGGATGTRMIARFSEALRRSGCRCYFVVNPYRPWSCTKEKLDETIARLTFQSRLDSFRYVSNPTLGPETTAGEIIDGHARVVEMLAGRPVDWLCAEQSLAGDVGAAVKTPVFPVAAPGCLSLL